MAAATLHIFQCNKVMLTSVIYCVFCSFLSQKTSCRIYTDHAHSFLCTGSIEHSRQIMEEAMKDGKVKAKNYVILILGFAGTGKTHVLYLLLGEPPPQLRVSTPPVQSPVRAVSMTKACTSGKMWKRVNRDDEIRMVAELAGSLSDGPVRKATNRPVLTVPATNDPLPTLTDLTASKDPLEVSESAEIIGGEAVVEDRSLSSICSDIVGDISREMIKCRDSHRTLKVTSFIIIDSGGQPQFLQTLPFFLRKRILHLFVQKLNERLRDFPDVELFGDDGKSIGTPYPSTLSNEQILRHFIRFVQSSSSAEYPPRFAIIGTHRDLEKECLDETRADKNSSMAKLLPSSVKQHAIKLGEDFIIPLNVKTPDEDDNKVIADLRQVIQSIPIEEAEIPLRWYGLELIMQRLVEKLGRGILKVSECEQATKELPLSPESLHYSDEDMESHVAFFCPGHKQGVETSDSPHPAKVASSQKRLICCNDDMIFSRLGDEHDVWFAEQTGEFSKLISSTVVLALIIMLMDLYFSFIGSVKKKRKMAVLPSAKGMQALGKRYTTQVTRFCIEWDPYM